MSRHWLSRARPLLGKISDHEIARRFGVARTIVSRQRRRLGIPPVRNVKPRGRPWVREVQALLGKLSDREIARRTGHHRKNIAEARRSFGIAAAPRHATTVDDRSWVPAVRHLLGRMTDREVGKRVGRSEATVGKARRELGIKRSWRRPKVRGRGKVPLMEELLRSKRSGPEIARITGIAVRTVYRKRRGMRGVMPSGVRTS